MELAANYTSRALQSVARKGARKRVQEFLARIHEKDSQIGAFIDVYDSWAVEQAEKVDAKLTSGRTLGKLGGLVVAVKNSVAISGRRLTCASKMLENYLAPYSATGVERIIAEDGIIIGSTNLDEFCCGSDCSRSQIVKTCNPLDLRRVPGGSSGGSAAAVAAGFCDLTLSEDTGGSIRCPASFCGGAGLHPTYGRVSRYGVSDMAMTFDQLGPISMDVLGSALLMSVISGEDPRDSTTAGMPKENNFEKELQHLPKKLQVGIPKQFFSGSDSQVEKLVRNALEKTQIANQGITVEEFDFPIVSHALPIYYLLVFSEFASAMQKFDGLKFGAKWSDADGSDLVEVVSSVRSRVLGPEVKRRILLGTYITTKEHRDAWYSKALTARQLLCNEFAKAFDNYDLLVGPTMPMVAWKDGEKSGNSLQMYLADVLTVPANCAGIPAGTVNVGLHQTEKMPVGLQVLGPAGQDELVLKLMAAVEKSAGLQATIPSI
jgi:aspartyl-tRNA(Asn)/glutamyl-tRNA(Gln) amidotransferase subunit A